MHTEKFHTQGPVIPFCPREGMYLLMSDDYSAFTPKVLDAVEVAQESTGKSIRPLNCEIPQSTSEVFGYYHPGESISITPELVTGRICSTFGYAIHGTVLLEYSWRESAYLLTELSSSVEDDIVGSITRWSIEHMPPAQPALAERVMYRMSEAEYADECTDEYAESVDATPAARPADEAEIIERLIDELSMNQWIALANLGLSEESLDFIFGHKAKLSRLRITRLGKIILKDYDSREIRLYPKDRALFLLYLRHPEGIAIKDLRDHFDELLDIYQTVTRISDIQANRDTVDKLCDPFSNEANVALSHIKKAFTEAVCASIAQNYYVNGGRGEIRTIPLDRSLVTWETVR